MSFAEDIDAAVARLERSGGLRLPTDGGGISPALIRAGQHRARDLRAEAMRGFFGTLFRLPQRARFEPEPTVSTVG